MQLKSRTLRLALQAMGLMAAACASVSVMAAPPAPVAANALPTGGQVAAGQATISQSGNTMTVNQSSQRAVVNWNTYNVGSNATVNYNQPNSQAVILNRVTSATPSQINGAINANGTVIISNANGVTFGKGAEVNAGAVVATTMNQSDAEFMAGSNTWSGNGTGKIVNKGKITATDINGYVALLAPEVRNQGVIAATVSANNAVVVGAGEKVTLNFQGKNLVGVTVDKAAVKALIDNKRAIEVNGGVIVMAAGSANQLMRSVIQNTGRVSASSMTNNGGSVELVAATVKNNGTIAANANGATGNGGSVKITANNVELGTKSDIQANAKTNGNGGNIQIWANETTSVAGKLSATGGAVSGNGGTIDTSAKQSVKFDANLTVDTSAKNGRYGQWIVDPLELTIDANAANLISNALRTTNVTLDATGSVCGAFGTCAQSQTGLVNFLAGADIYSNNVATVLRVLAAGGTVNVNNNIEVGQVYIEAATINVNGNISTTGGANSNILLLGAQINILGNLGSNGQTTNNANSTSTTGANRRRLGVDSGLTADNSIYTTNGGNIMIAATGDITIGSNATITANGQSGGNVSIVSQTGTVTHSGVVDAVGTTNQGGTVTIAGQSGTILTGALTSVDGSTQGGVLQIGIAQNVGSGTTLAPPAIGPPASYFNNTVFSVASIITTLDANTGLSASATSAATSNLHNAGQITVIGQNNLTTAATLHANADNGGLVYMVSSAGDYQNTGYIQTNGGAGLGGTILVSGSTSTTLIGAHLEANGFIQGGTIKIGNDAANGLLPFSQAIYLDALTTLNTYQLSSANSSAGGFIETSGNTLRLLASINAGRGGMWLIDPNDIIVDSTTAASIVSGLASSNVTIQTSASSYTCTGATCSNTPTGTGNIVITSSIATNTNNNLTFAATGAILLNGGVNIWLNTSNTSTYTQSTGTGSLFMGGVNVSTITASNWNGTCTGCYASATAASPFAGIGLGVMANASISGVTLTSGSVSIMVGGSITVAGSNALSSNAYAGIALYAGSTMFAGSSSNSGNIYFYGISSAGAGMQLSYGSPSAIDVRASQAIYVYGKSSYNDTNSNTGSDLGHGAYINGSILSAPTVQITGYNTATCTGAAANCAGVSLGWITTLAQTTNIYTNNLNITADSVALGYSPVNVSVCNGNCGGTSTLGSPVTTFGLNFAAYSQSSGVPTAAMTFYYFNTGTTSSNSTSMPMPGSNYANYLSLPSISTTWSSYAFSTNTSMSIPSGNTFTVAGPVSLTGTQITIGGTLSSTGLVTISNSGASTISGTLTGTGASFAKSGAGTLTITSAQSYTGSTTVSAGTLQMGSGGSIANSSGLTMSGTANFDLNGINTTVGSLTGVSGNNIYNSAATTTAVLTVSGGTTTYAGVIKNNTGTGGTVGLVVSASGNTLTLSGANTYSGGTTVNGGILQFNSSYVTTTSAVTSSPIGTGNLVINAGGTLDLNGKSFGASNQTSNIPTITMSGTDVNNQAFLVNSSATAVTEYGQITLSKISGASGALANVIASVSGGTINQGINPGGYSAAANIADGSSGTNYSGLQIGTSLYTGTVVMNGLNTYQGGTSIRGGTLKFMHNAYFKCSTGAACVGGGTTTASPVGTGVITILGGGTLDINGSGDAYTSGGGGAFLNNIIMAGDSSTSQASLVSSYTTIGSGSRPIVQGNITLSNVSGSTSPGTFVDVIGLIPSVPGWAMLIMSTISDGVGINYAGLQIGQSSYAGTVQLAGANTYSGGTAVNGGVAQFNSSYVTTTSAVTSSPIGTGNLVINAGGTVDLNGKSFGTSTQTSNIPTITMSGTGAGSGQALLINTLVTTTSMNVYGPITLTNTSSANLSANVIAQVDQGSATNNSNYNIVIKGAIGDGTGTSYAGLQIGSAPNSTINTATLNFTGTVQMSGASTYNGVTTVAYGTLRLGAAGSGANSPLGTVVGGTVVNSGAVLDLNGISLVTTEPLSISGTGISSSGVLTNSNATAAGYSGLVTLAGPSSIISSSGAINLTSIGTITGSGYGLTLGGSTGGSIASIIGTGSGALTKQGTSTWTLTGLSTYTGVTTVSQGILVASSLADGGVASSIGQSTNAATNLVFSGGNLQYSGTTLASTDRLFTVSYVGSTTLSTTNTGSLTFSNPNSIVNSATSANTLLFSNSNNVTFTFNPIWGNPSSGVASINKTGSGTLVLGGLNTYTGTTTIGSGTLSVSALDNGGNPSNIGQSSNAASSLIIGASTTFQFTGTSASTDRLFTIQGAATINAGSGNLTFSNTGAITNTGAASTLTLSGTGSATLLPALVNGSGALSLTKSGTGTWALGGLSTYTGTTTVSGGTLQFAPNAYFYCGASVICDAVNKTISSGPVGKSAVTIGNGSYLDLNGNGDSASNGLFYNGITLSATSGAYAYLINSNASVSAAVYGSIGLTKQSINAGNYDNTDVFAQAAGSATLKIAGVIADSTGTYASGLGVGAGTINTVSYAGTVIFSGANTYSPQTAGYGTLINYGTLQIAGDSNLGATGSIAHNDIQLLNGGTLLVSGQSGNATINTYRNIWLSTGGGTIANNSSAYSVTFSSVITGSTQLTIGSAGNLGTIVLSGSAVTGSGGFTTSVTSSAMLDLKLDSINTTTTANFNTNTYTGAGSITIEPLTSGGSITLGGTGSTLNLATTLFTGTSGTGRKFADGFANITIGSSSAGNLNIAASATAAFSDSVTLLSGGNITINSGASVTTSQAGGNLVLAATGNFLNLAGNSALQTTDAGSTDRWIVYSTSPSADNFGSSGTLVSGNKAYWGSTYTTLAPSAVGSGNRYVFSTGGTVTVTTTNASMTYGIPIDLSGNYTASNISLNAAPTGSPYLVNSQSDLFATAPTITSTGNTSTANVGSYAITGSGAVGATGFGTIAYTNTGTLTVNPAVITLGVVGSKTYDGSAVFDASPSNSNVTVSGLANGDTLATVTANSPNVSANGSNYFVSFTTANPSSQSNYTLVSGYNATTNAATINPATVTVSANATNMTYGATALPTFAYSAGSLISGNSFSGSLTSAAPVYNAGASTYTANAGATYPITIGTLSAGSNYTISYTGTNLTMVAAPLTVTATAANMTYGATSLPTLAYTTSALANGNTNSVLSGNLSTTATPYVAGSSVTGNAGVTYAITQGTVTAGNNYAITYVPADITMTKAVLNVTGNSPNMVYGASTQPTLSYAYSGYVNGDSSAAGLSGTPTLSSSAPVYNAGASTYTGNAGATYAVTPSVSGVSSTNYTFTPVNGTLTIVAAPLTVTATATNMTYGATSLPTLAYTTSALVNGNTSSVLSGNLSTTATPYVAGVSVTGDAGITYTISQGSVTAGNNYAITYVPANITMTKAVLNVTGNSPSMVYGASTQPTLSYAYSGYVNGDSSAAGLSGTPTVSSAAPVYVAGTSITGNAGATYAVTPSVSGVSATNYTFTPVDGTLTMTPAPLTITGTKVYTGNGNFTYTQMAVAGAQNSETISLSAGSATTSSANVNTYNGTSLSSLAINVSGGNALASNYSLPASGNLSITPATLTYTATAANSTYGSAPNVNAGTVTGFVGSDTQANATTGTLLFSTTADHSSNVGSYAINGSGLTANNGNYTFVQAAGNATALTVNPATLTYTATAANSTYGSAPSVNAGTVTGFVNSDTQANATTGTLTFGTTASNTTNVGSYAITGSGLAANNGNYTFVQAAGNATALTVNPATLTYTATAANSTYGSTPSVNAGTVTGFVNNETQAGATTGTLLFSTAATSSSSVGSYAITGSGLAANNGNYTFVQAAGNSTALTVNAAPLTITGTKVYDGNGNFTYSQMAVAGGQNSETISLTAGSATTSSPNVNAYNGTSLSGLGINVTGGNALASNYSLPASGNLSITPATLTYTATAANSTYGSTPSVNAGTVTGFVNNETQAGATTGTMLFSTAATSSSNVGSYAITGSGLAANNGNYTFVQAAGNSSALTIGARPITLTADAQSTVYGTALGLGTTAYTVSGSGLASGDAINAVTLQYNGSANVPGNTNAATYTNGIVASGATGSGGFNTTNYAITYAPGTLTVNAAPLTITGTKVYDGNGNFTYSQMAVTGAQNSETISLTAGSATTSSANVNTYNGTSLSGLAINVTGGNALASNYNLPASGNLSITQRSITVTADAQSTTYGTALGLGTTAYTVGGSGLASGDAINAVTLQYNGSANVPSNTNTAIYTNGIVASGATGSGGFNTTNYAITYAPGTLTVNAAPLTITGTKVYDGNGNFTYSQMAVAGAQNSETISLAAGSATTSSGNVNSYNGTSLSGLAINVTGGNALASNYSLPASGNLSITPATLTYTATAANSTYGSTPSVNAGTVTGFVNNETQAGATTGTLLFSTAATSSSSVGSYAINGSGLTANNGNYTFVQAAGNSTALTVNPAPLTITGTKVYDGNGNFTYSQMAVAGAQNSETISLTAGSATTSSPNVNAYNGTSLSSLAINVTGGNALASNYSLPASGNLSITPATLTYTATAANSTYGSTPSVNAGTVTGFVNNETQSGATTGTLLFATGATAASNVGSYAINGSGLTANNGNYTFVQAAGNSTALTVNPAPLTITGTKVYDGNGNFTYRQMAVAGAQNSETISLTAGSATTSSGNVNTYNGTSLSGLGINVAGGNALASNYSLPASGNLSITPATLTYTATAANSTYGNTPSVNAGSVTGFMGSDTQANATTGTLLFSTAATSSSNVGSYGITGSGLIANNGNYTFVQAAANSTALTVNAAPLTITGTKVYDGNGNFTYSQMVVAGAQNSETVSLTAGSATTSSPNVNTYNGTSLSSLAINVTGGNALASNYSLPASGNLSITPATLTYTATAANSTYGSTPSVNAGTVTGFVGSDTQANATTGTLLFSTAATPSSNVGSYGINGSGLTANNGNYTFVQAAGNNTAMTVNPAPLTITGTKVYDGNGNFTYSQMAVAGAQNGETISLTAGSATTSSPNIGTYTGVNLTGVTVNVAGGNASVSNYTVPSTGTLSILGRAVTITADAQTTTYGTALNLGTSAFSITGGALATGDTVTSVVLQYNGNATVASNTSAATYTNGIVASGATGTGNFNSTNYDITYVPGNLVVNQKALSVTATATNMTYGATALPTMAYTSNGLVNGDTLSGSLATTAPVYNAGLSTRTGNVGSTYAMTQGTLSAGSNYALTYTPADITVVPATLTVTANNQSRVYGNANPTLTQTISGFVNGDSSSVVSGTAYGSTTATTTTGVGSATITARNSGLSASNYNFYNLVNGTLSITARPITLTASAQTTTYGTAFGLGTTAYTTSGGTLASGDAISGVVLQYNASATVPATTAAGTYTNGIVASGATGTGGFNGTNYAITYMPGNLVVNKQTLTITANSATKVYGSTATYGAGSTAFTSSGLVNGQTIGTVTITDTNNGGAATANAGGTYYLTPSAATGGTFTPANYNISYVPGVLTVSQAALNIGVSKIYDGSALLYSWNSTVITTTGGVRVYDAQITGTVTPSSSNVGAYTNFVSGGFSLVNSPNYTLVGGTTTATINTKTVYATGTKSYDASGTFGYTQLSVNSGVAGETINITGGSGTASSANVATYNNASISGITITVSGGNARASNYAVATVGTLTITPATLTYAATAANSTYGNTPSVNAGSVTGFMGSDTQANATTGTLLFSTAATSSSNVGSYGITGSGLTANNGNYTFVQAAGNNTALTVNPATLTYTATAANSTYGSTPSVNAGTVTGFVNSDTQANATTGTLLFSTTASNTSNVGSYAITGSGLTANNGNYTFVQAVGNSTALTVNPAPLIITGTKVYNGNGNFTYSQMAVAGAQNGETVSLTAGSATTSSANVNTYNGTSLSGLAINVTGGNARASNYSLPASGNLSITQRSITVTADAQSTTYGTALGLGTTAYTVGGSGLASGDAINAVTLQYNGSATVPGNTNAATYSNGIVASGATGSGGFNTTNYAITYAPANLVVDQKPVTITNNLSATTYDGVTNYASLVSSAGYTVTPLAGSDAIGSVSQAISVGGNPVSGVAQAGSFVATPSAAVLSSGLASNYVFSYVAATDTVAKANLAVTATQSLSGNIYNGSAYTGAYTTTLLGSDTATVTGMATGTNAGTYLSNLQVSGAALANYNTPVITNANLVVSPKPITISGQVAESRTYDATTNAVINSANASLVGVVAGDNVLLNTAGTYGTFASPNVANGVAVAVVGNTLGGTAAGNYVLAQPTGLAANITPAALTVTANNSSKVIGQNDPVGYNGASYDGFVGGQTSAVLSGTLAISRTNSTQNNAGTYNGVLQPSGLSASNYTINYVNGNFTIVAADTLSIQVGNTSTTYGTAAAYTPTSVQYLNSQQQVLLTLTQTAHNGNTYTYSDGLGGTATFTLGAVGATSSSGNLVAGNYNITGLSFSKVGNNFNGSPVYTGALAINQMGVQASTNNVSKVYDGTTAMNGLSITLTPSVIAGDQVTAAGTGAFGQANVGTGISYNIANLALTGADSGNYYLTGGTAFSGSNGVITPATLTYIATPTTSTYGNTPSVNAGSVTGFVNGQNQNTATTGSLTFTTNASASSNVGSYAITGSGLTANNGNYTFVQAAGNVTALTVNPATLTYVATPTTMVAGNTPSVNTGTVTGFVGSDTLVNATNGIMVFSTPATAASSAGSYAINGSGLTANNGNYNFVQASGNATALTITPQPAPPSPPSKSNASVAVFNCVVGTYEDNGITYAQTGMCVSAQ